MSPSQIAGGARAASAITRAAAAPMPACRGARRRPAARRSPAVTATPPGRGVVPAAGRPRAATPPPIMDPPVSGRIEQRPLVESVVRFSQIHLRRRRRPPPPINAQVCRMTARDPKGSSHPPLAPVHVADCLPVTVTPLGGILRAYAMAGAPPLPGGMRPRSQLCHSARRHGVPRAGAAERPAHGNATRAGRTGSPSSTTPPRTRPGGAGPSCGTSIPPFVPEWAIPARTCRVLGRPGPT